MPGEMHSILGAYTQARCYARGGAAYMRRLRSNSRNIIRNDRRDMTTKTCSVGLPSPERKPSYTYDEIGIRSGLNVNSDLEL